MICFKGFPARLGILCLGLIFGLSLSGKGSPAGALAGKTGGTPTSLSGNWPTFGNGPAHCGYFPGTLGNGVFTNRWTANFSASLQPVAVGLGQAYVVNHQNDGTGWLTALDEASGQINWQLPLGIAYVVNPPTYDSGTVYVQRIHNYDDSQLLSIDAVSGAVNWQAPFSAVWEPYMAPTVANGVVWTGGGWEGGLYAFNQTNGSQLFFKELERSFGWTPTYWKGRLFSCSDAHFREHNPTTGAILWSTNVGMSGFGMNGTIVATNEHGYVVDGSTLYDVNLATHQIAWQQYSVFSGTPAVVKGIVYAISNNAVASFKKNGDELEAYVADSPLSNQPIITDDVVIVGSYYKTYIFDLATHTLRQTLNVGGNLSLANGVLYVASGSGQLYAFSSAHDLQLLVQGNPSQYGQPAPQQYGTNFFSQTCTLTNQVAELVQTNMTRFRCAGWTGTGSVPPSGTDSVVVVTLQTNSTLTWNWTPVEFQLICHAAGPGSVNLSNDWYAAGSSVTVTATPQDGCRFVKWIGDLTDDAATNPTLTLSMNQATRLVAVFGQAEHSPLSGEWPTFGNGPAHTGYFHGLLGDASFTNRWTTSLPGPLQPVAVGGNQVYATLAQAYQNNCIAALDAFSGRVNWQLNFTYIYSLNPPTYDSGAVYVQRCYDSGSQLWNLDSSTGATNWQALFEAQTEQYMAPTVADGRIWVEGGAYGGLYGFNEDDGSQIFHQNLDHYDRWTPTYWNGRVFSWVGGNFREHDPLTGTSLWITNLNSHWYGIEMNRTIAIADGQAYLTANPNLYAIDLTHKSVAWSATGQFSGTPAVANGAVYAISNNIVAAFRVDGASLGTYVADSTLLQQPIVTDDVLIVSSDSKVYVFDLVSHALRQTLPAGGNVSLANDILYVASSSGQLYAFYTSHALQLVIYGHPARCGDPSPHNYGRNFVPQYSTVTNRVSKLGETNMGRFQCLGWTGTGSVPASGTDTVVIITMRTNSTLTWNWLPTEFQLTCRATSGGDVDTTNVWFAAGSSVTVTATPHDGFRFLKWMGDVSPALATNAVVTLPMNQGRRIYAVFEATGVSPLAADWPMFGNGPAHTGYVPGLFGERSFSPRWTNSQPFCLQQVAVGAGQIYVTTGNLPYLTAIDAYTGQLVWQHSFPGAYVISPPSYDSGSVYVQSLNYGALLWSIDATSGAVNWQAITAPCLTPGEQFMAATVADGKVWVDGGNAVLAGFNQKDGSRLFSLTTGASGWTPSYYDGRLFSWVTGTFMEDNPASGSYLWYTNLGGSWGWNWNYEMDRTIAVSDNYAYFVGNPNLYAIDLSKHTVAWNDPGAFSGTPAVANGVVYAICSNSVIAYSLDGIQIGKYTANSALTNQPIVTDDLLIAGSDSDTYIFDLSTQELRQNLNVAGNLSLANGVLYVASSSGRLYAFSSSPDAQLIIQGEPSSYGHPLPQNYGINYFQAGATLTNQVSRLVETNMARLQCLGWTGTGNVPAHGTDTSVIITLETNSTLTWNWAPIQFQLVSRPAGHGQVDKTNAWYSAGDSVTLTATPENGYRFVKWTGDVPAETATNATLSLVMNQGRQLIAVFSLADPGSVSKDWPTFGGGASHTGYVPMLAAGARFGLRWTANPGGRLQQAAIGGNRVFVSPHRSSGEAFVESLHEYSGQILWRHDFYPSDWINPPTFDSGAVFVQRGDYNGKLWSLDAVTGTVKWQTSIEPSRYDYMAPTVADGKVWTLGGNYTGLHGFIETNGSQFASQGLTQCDGWTPTYLDGRLFSWSSGYFREHDPANGTTLWSTNLLPFWMSYSMNEVTIAAADGAAYFIGDTNLYSIDLTNRTPAWKVGGYFTGTPAVANGAVYAISGTSVLAFGADGSTRGTYTTDSELLNQPIVTDDILIAASPSATYIFDLFSFKLQQTIPVGGLLSLANGVLYIAADSGLYAWSLGQDVQLVINSANGHAGDPFPFVYGTNFVSRDTQISPQVTSPFPGDKGVRYLAAGWTGTGSVPATGTGCVTTAIITNDSSITWNWNTQYYLDATATVSNGTINIPSGWFDAGTQVTITATPGTYYHFAGWGGDVTNTNPTVSIAMDRPITARARFEPDTVTHDVPTWWLAQHGLPTTDAGALADSDHDGVANWLEYRAGSDPRETQKAPKFTTHLANQTVGSGSDVNVTPDITGSAPLSFQWQFRGAALADQTNSALTLSNVQVSDSGSYTLAIRNPAGHASSSFNLVVTNALAWAVNATNLIWSSGGDAPWYSQTDITHDDLAAAQSGPFTNVHNSWIEAVVTGPATLGFWARVLSDTGNGGLAFSLDGAPVTSITPQYDWQKQFVAIPAGRHSVTWSHTNFDLVLGQDNAWLDEVTVTPGVPEAPVITRQPQSVIATPNSMVTFNVQATGTLLTYQWYVAGWAIPQATGPQLKIQASESNAGLYTVVISGAFGQITSEPALLSVSSSLATALEYGGSVWLDSTPDASWFLQKRITHDHIDAAQSGKINDGQTSSIENWITGPGTLSFWWKVSSEENCDFLQLYVNDLLGAQISGNVDWQQQTIYITDTGNIDLRFSYSKDGNVSRGLDCGWLDGMKFTPDVVPVISKSTDQTVFLGSTITLAPAVTGSAPLSFTWFHNGDQIWANNSGTLKLSNVQWQDAGVYVLSVANNAGTTVSQPIFLTVVPMIPDQMAMPGATVQFNFPALKDQLPCRQWYSNWSPLSNGARVHGATASRLRIDNVTQDDAGTYSADYGVNPMAQATLTVLSPSQVLVWGYDESGNVLQPPSDYTDVIAIAAGGYHNLALFGNGTVAGWGAYEFGQLDFPFGLDHIKAIAAGQSHSLLLQEDGTVLAFGDDFQERLQVPAGLTGVIAIAAGGYHNLALRTNGTVVAWGANDSGQSTVPQGLHDVTRIAAGGGHSLALRKNGSVVAWGDNASGQIMVPAAASQVVAIAAGAQHSLAVRNNGTVIAWGANASGQSQVPKGLTGVVAVAAGASHSLALKSDGTMVGWGENYKTAGGYTYTGAASPPLGLKNVAAIAANDDHSMVLIRAPVIISQPADQDVAGGTDVEFDVTATGVAPLYYQWRYNNQIIRSATNAALSLPHVQSTQAGSYSVLVRNAAGSTLSAGAKLTVPARSGQSRASH